MSNISEKKAKTFLVKFMMYIAMFLVVLGVSVVINETNNLSSYTTALLAVTPVIPVILLLRLVVAHYRSLDEYIQSVMGESLLWAVGIVGCSAMAYGLMAEMIELPSFSPAFMLPAIAFTFGVAQYFQLKSDFNEE